MLAVAKLVFTRCGARSPPASALRAMSSFRAMPVANYHIDELRLRRGARAGRSMVAARLAWDREQFLGHEVSVVIVAMVATGGARATASEDRDTWWVLVVGRVDEIASRHGCGCGVGACAALSLEVSGGVGP